MLSATFSKDYCSCRFIVGQTDGYCREVAKQYISVKEYKVDLDQKIVYSAGLGESATVQFVEGKGCHFKEN